MVMVACIRPAPTKTKQNWMGKVGTEFHTNQGVSNGLLLGEGVQLSLMMWPPWYSSGWSHAQK